MVSEELDGFVGVVVDGGDGRSLRIEGNPPLELAIVERFGRGTEVGLCKIVHPILFTKNRDKRDGI
jgi:hypothetical protein